jgi:hypothetical protein
MKMGLCGTLRAVCRTSSHNLTRQWLSRHAIIENLAAASSSDSKRAPGYNLISTASFKNVSQKVISAVRIHFDVYDAFQTKLTSVTGTAYGHFSPNALIEPTRNGRSYVYTPSSPAWHFSIAWSGISPADAAQTTCWVQDARFEDGSIWRAGAGLQTMPDVTSAPDENTSQPPLKYWGPSQKKRVN